jgi:hypothetical protein
MRRCIIHIGHPKTGSTFLQHCLHLNADLFAACNYWLPSDFTAFGSYDLAPLSQAGAVISGNLAPLHEVMCVGPYEMRAKMHEYLFAAPGMPADCDVLLSSELFFYYVNALAQVIGVARDYGLTPEIVAFLPRQDRACVSGYLQNVRYHGFSAGVIEFLLHDKNIRYCAYAETLAVLQAKAPDVQITLRTFDPQFLRDGDVLTEFLSACRVDAADCERPPRISNQGLTLEHYELLRSAALLRLPDAAARLRDDEVELSAQERARIAAFYYRPEVERFVAREYLAGNEKLVAQMMPAAGAVEQRYWQTFDSAAEPVALDTARFERLRRHAFG